MYANQSCIMFEICTFPLNTIFACLERRSFTSTGFDNFILVRGLVTIKIQKHHIYFFFVRLMFSTCVNYKESGLIFNSWTARFPFLLDFPCSLISVRIPMNRADQSNFFRWGREIIDRIFKKHI